MTDDIANSHWEAINTNMDGNILQNNKTNIKLPKEILDIMELDSKLENNPKENNPYTYGKELQEQEYGENFFVKDTPEDNNNLYTFSGEEECVIPENNPIINESLYNTNYVKDNNLVNIGVILEKNLLISMENSLKEILPNMNIIIENMVKKKVQEYLENNKSSLKEIMLQNLQIQYRDKPLSKIIEDEVRESLRKILK
jgi:hypothetical protein